MLPLVPQFTSAGGKEGRANQREDIKSHKVYIISYIIQYALSEKCLWMDLILATRLIILLLRLIQGEPKAHRLIQILRNNALVWQMHCQLFPHKPSIINVFNVTKYSSRLILEPFRKYQEE